MLLKRMHIEPCSDWTDEHLKIHWLWKKLMIFELAKLKFTIYRMINFGAFLQKRLIFNHSFFFRLTSLELNKLHLSKECNIFFKKN